MPASGGGTTNFLRADGTWAAPAGGGGGSLATLSDTNIASPTNGQVLTYNSTSSKWENQTAAGGGNMSTTTYDPASIAQQVLGTTATQTMSNKRIVKRVLTETSNATPSINTDSYDGYRVTALAANITSWTIAGTPNTGDTFKMSILDNGTARTITWGTSFENGSATLPTTTVASVVLDVGFEWNPATSKWRCIAAPSTTLE